MSSTLIHPEMAPLFYLGSGITIAAAGCLFSNSQGIQIIARAVLLGAGSQTVRIWLGARNCIQFYNISFNPKTYTDKRADLSFSSSNLVVQGICHGILHVPFQALLGLTVPSVARIRYSKFSTTVNAKQLLRPLFLIHVLAVVASEFAAWKCTEWVPDQEVHKSVPQELILKWKGNLIRRNIYLKCLCGSYAALIGTIVIQRLGYVKIL